MIKRVLLSFTIALGVLVTVAMVSPPASAGGHYSASYCSYHWWEPECWWWEQWYFRRYGNTTMAITAIMKTIDHDHDPQSRRP